MSKINLKIKLTAALILIIAIVGIVYLWQKEYANQSPASLIDLEKK